MELDLNCNQWKAIFKAVRTAQQKNVVGSRWYKDYDEILDTIWHLAYTEEETPDPM